MADVHFIGIGGTGLSAIARLLLERGQSVSGSDRQDSPALERLRELGAHITLGHAPENVGDAAVVLRSSAIPDDNVEVQAARQAGIPVLKRADYLGELLADHFVIAVAGSHGKTTITAMLAWVLTALNQRPSFIVGGEVENLGTNASAGKGRYFVIEADEYDYMFLGMNPNIAVVANVEYDHPDCFPTPEDFQQAFRDFAARLKQGGVLLAGAGDPGAADLLAWAAGAGKAVLSYGLDGNRSWDYRAADLASKPGGGFTFEAYRKDVHLAQVTTQVPGEHNVLNALAALAVADQLGLSAQDVALALADFRGAGRRFELRGEAAGVTVIDDYGHHPTEIAATLAAARERFPQHRVWAVWQPHTYSRTLTLLAGFSSAFGDADQVVVTPVYAARERAPEGFSLQTVVKVLQHPAVQAVESLEAATTMLASELRAGDVLLVLSAGDAIQVSEGVLAALKEKESQNVSALEVDHD